MHRIAHGMARQRLGLLALHKVASHDSLWHDTAWHYMTMHDVVSWDASYDLEGQ